MDGYPKPKTKQWRGDLCSETRYLVNVWLEQELPKITGDVINISSGGSNVPKMLLTNPGVRSYKTFDQKFYGDAKNRPDFVGDVHNLPKDWSGKWDCALCIESFECYVNPQRAMLEIHRILKPGGILVATAPFNYVWFGKGSTKESLKKKNPVKDYWRLTYDAWDLLLEPFATKTITGFGGSSDNDRFVYCVLAVKKTYK